MPEYVAELRHYYLVEADSYDEAVEKAKAISGRSDKEPDKLKYEPDVEIQEKPE
jgi:hypothetical protein